MSPGASLLLRMPRTSSLLTAALILMQLTDISAMAAGPLVRALSKPRPLLVHIWDPKPAELTDFAVDDVSEACRKAGATAILTMPELLERIEKEQAVHRGNFPGPVPVIVDCGLEGFVGEASAATPPMLKEWARQGASAIGLRYYELDWPEEATLEGALKDVVANADEAGLAAILMPEFGANGEEGLNGASSVAERVGAVAALTKVTQEEQGAVALGCWDGTDVSLQRLRGAGFGGLILKNACGGDVAYGAHIKSPSLAAQALTKLIKKALSKDGKAIWGGAGGVSEGKAESMGSYFDRG